MTAARVIVAEIPLVAAGPFRALAPHGYRHLAIETGEAYAPQPGSEADRIIRLLQ